MPIYFFLASIILSFLLSYVALKISRRYRLFDLPNEERKIHQNPIPNVGGIAMFVSFWIVLIAFIIIAKTTGYYLKYEIGLLVASSILFIVGILDDRKKLRPLTKIIAQIIAGLVIIASGVGITYINNPFGGFIFLNQIQIPIAIFDSVHHITLIADILALLWIVGMINVVNFLDGLDGLASGVSVIAFAVIYFLSVNPTVNQPLSATISVVAIGVVLGFLPFNLNPAKIFMGDTGSMFLGLLLATLAIIAGGKVATALLVLGLPIFDGLWVATARLLQGKAPWVAGRDHLHHKLLDLGLSRRVVVIIFWIITALFGSIALISDAQGKLLGLIILFFLLFVATATISKKAKIS